MLFRLDDFESFWSFLIYILHYTSIYTISIAHSQKITNKQLPNCLSYKIKNPESPLPGNSIRSKCAICNNGTSQHSQIRAPRNIRCFLRRIGWFFCTRFRWLLWNLKWLGIMKVYIRFQFAWNGGSISMYIIVYLLFQYPVHQ